MGVFGKGDTVQVERPLHGRDENGELCSEFVVGEIVPDEHGECMRAEHQSLWIHLRFEDGRSEWIWAQSQEWLVNLSR